MCLGKAWSKCTFTKESIERLEWKTPPNTTNQFLLDFKFEMVPFTPERLP
jgi:hypothetical protein